MPVSKHGGQMITFAVETGQDFRFEGFARVRVTKTLRTCRKIAAHRGFPGLARRIADMNNIRNPRKKLKIGRTLRVPGKLREKFSFSVLAGDTAPVVVRGYPKIDVVDRSERTGLSVFTGYDPVVLSIPVRFEIDPPDREEKGSFIDQDGGGIIEDKIRELEQMAGRGDFPGAAMGPPALVAVSTSDAAGDPIPLIPVRYQTRANDPYSPVYWISDIDWDQDPVRNVNGRRIRQLATIELTQYVRPKLQSARERKQARNPRNEFERYQRQQEARARRAAKKARAKAKA